MTACSTHPSRPPGSCSPCNPGNPCNPCGRRWVGVTGRDSTLNGKPIRTRPCKDLSLAFLYATTPHMFSSECE